MSLAAPEDAASLLEQFMHDVANTPAEVSHLLEEIQAKDLQIQTFKDEITKRDVQLQRHVRMQGGHVNNPKEETFNKTIADCFDKCDILQAEKCGLSEKALIVLERHVKRLDVGLRNLSLREEFPADWNGPSMLSASGNVTGVSTPIAAAVGGGPLQSMSGNVGTSGGAANIANAAQMRMAQAGGLKGSASPTSQTPTNAPRNQREGSSEANKRRRLNASLGSLPAASSNLRQSSLGPGTPTGGTPSANGPSASRQGSAQPPRPSAQSQKKAPAGSTNANAAPSSKKVAPPHPSRKRDRHRTSTSATTTTKKGDRRRQLTASTRSTPGTAGGADSTSPSPSPTPSALARNQNDGSTTTPDPPGPHAHAHNLAPGTAPNPKGSRSPHPPHSHDTKTSKRASASPSASPSASDDDDDDEEEEADDNNLYCFCQRRSFGPMVGCDNDNCEYQWFHYGCVGIEVEPTGEWLCPSCRKLPGWKVEKGGSQ